MVHSFDCHRGLSLLVTLVGLQACMLPARAHELDLSPLKIDALMRIDVGVTRSGTPIPAFITQDDLTTKTNKARLLVVAGLDGSPNTTAAAIAVMHNFYTDPQYAALRSVLAVSVIPCGNPDGLARGLKNDNAAGGNPAVGYPPAGDAYTSPTNPEAQYLWRWIGMHAPDHVIELVDAAKRGPVDEQSQAANSLASQLSKHTVCGVAKIDATAWGVPAGDRSPFVDLGKEGWKDIIDGLRESMSTEASEARREMISRSKRTPVEVCQQLSKVYGHELPTPAYIPAVACLARLRFARLTDDKTVATDLERIGAVYLDGSKPSLTEKSSGSDIAGHILWGELYEVTKDSRARQLVINAANRAFDSQGIPLEAMPTHSEMSDAVFMGCPILAQAGRLTGDTKYFDMCLKHMRFMLKMNLRSDGLHRHSPLDETAWGRGNGFPALGLALSLAEIPESYQPRAEMLAAFRAHLAALKKHQDVTGAWHQVVDHPESYRELTSTCMIVYAMIRGVRSGWLDKQEYEPLIQRGWQAIQLRVRADGELVDVCTGTGKMRSLREYLDRIALLGRDGRGGAMALLVASEMAAWKDQ